jgi:dipeptidyl aminopeptidase/acylaminoacyl peptidase
VPFRNELAIVLAGETIAACPHGFVGPPRVLLAPLDGGEETPLALPEDAKVVIDLDAAADGRLLVTAFESGCRLWCVRKDAPAEELHREAAWIGGARWDREGRGVFFVTGERGRRSLRWRPVPAESGEAATLIEGIPLGEKLSVSRDGRRVIYHRENAYTNLVRVDPARGGATSQVTQGTAEIGRAVVSPDGDSLVYATREGPSHAIVVAALRPGAPRTRIARTHRPCAAPAWSPDGGRIAFRREEGSAWHIVTVSAQGDDERVWSQTRPSAGVGEWIGEWVYLDWLSPTRIVYTSENNGPLRVVDLESGVDRDFLSEPATGWMFSIRVSPDRRRVAFYWNRGAGPTRGIYFADADGGNTRMVLPGRAMVVGWADGGASLVVARIATLGGEVSTSEAFAACLERVELGAGATTTLWTPPDGFNVVDVSLMPRTGELLVVRGEAMSDAWLLEDPLGRPA